jgi:hypothetical protein
VKKLEIISISFLLAFWFSSYLYSIFQIELIGYSCQLLLSIYGLIYILINFNLLKINKYKLAIFFLVLNLLIILSSFKEINSNFFIIYLLKNLFYLNFSIIIGIFIYQFVSLNKLNILIIFKIIFIFVFIASLFLLYKLFNSGFLNGLSLLNSDYAEMYQGISRYFGLVALLSVFSLPLYLSVLFIILSFFISISFQSFGGFVFLICASFLFFKKNKSYNRVFINSIFLIASIAFFIILLADENIFVKFLERGLNKLNSTDAEGRVWLYKNAFRMILEDPLNFFTGASYYLYSCITNDCVYRHAHNLFLNLWISFGMLSILFILPVIFTLIMSFKNVFNDKNIYCSILFIAFFVLSLFGGDLEQNRNIFLLLPLVYLSGGVHFPSTLSKKSNV